jgi:hypothetical protein
LLAVAENCLRPLATTHPPQKAQTETVYLSELLPVATSSIAVAAHVPLTPVVVGADWVMAECEFWLSEVEAPPPISTFPPVQETLAVVFVH